ncbi:MAG: Gfo/Idh/MocA family oxidoreductase, partial [Pseudolabrys sp.]
LRTEESRAGGMTGMGIHVLDCFRDMVGPMKRISALSRARALKMETGDTTSALIEFENGATGTLATTMKTPFAWRVGIFGEVFDLPADNHLGRNLDYFAKAALGQGKFPISPDGILQTAAALEAVFKSVDANGAWMTV